MKQDAFKSESPQSSRRRLVFEIRGIVQGVGFRPFVYRTALSLGLSGFVRNQSGSVWIEVEGETVTLEAFAKELGSNPPPLAQIDSIRTEELPLQDAVEFEIVPSMDDRNAQVFISPDVATCDDCLRELFDPADPRYLYPFLNCTNCGPRLTIIQGAPYDRQRTTMSAFPMCGVCRRDYENPADRRFHAQPVACARCGPQLQLLTNEGEKIDSDDPVQDFANAVISGRIAAMKGLGGYHLVCDAGNEVAVQELRRRKQRDQKPFALMVASLEQAERYCEIDPLEQEHLTSSRRPIVLLRRRTDSLAESLASGISPGNPNLGVMLPYTPLHHLLFRKVGDRPLVMTSGNRADEPIAYDDEDAVERLGGLVDFILTNNRPIHVRCDDSVTRIIDGQESPIRRSRGDAPAALSLPKTLSCPTLAVGGQLKGAFALGREKLAFLSHHLGDLDHYSAYQAFERDVELYEELFETHPELIVHDLHPDYASTNYALRRAKEEGLPTLAVQHHHAHIASCMADHQLSGPVIGVAFDGTGYGTDGTIWGGEFLIVEDAGFERVGHLRKIALPGGDAAVREPWRIAAACLMDAGCDLSLLSKSVAPAALKTVEQMVLRKFNSPMTSSMGRVFDAVAALTGVRNKVSFEGQAAMELEWLATSVPPDGSYPIEISSEMVVDLRPMILAIRNDIFAMKEKFVIARRFHSSILELVALICGRLRNQFHLNQVVLSGGVFMNALLSTEVNQRLSRDGFQVYRHRHVPTNDGGLCLGQLAVAAANRVSPKR